MSSIQPIPAGYHTITPYLSIKGAAQALEFYKKAFGATEVMRMQEPGQEGKIGHAEIKIGDSYVMLADEYPGMAFKSPESLRGTAVTLLIYVENVDAAFEQALAAGAKQLKPVADQFYGDRSGTLQDPFGHVWHLATHIEDVSMEEMKKRAAQAFSQG